MASVVEVCNGALEKLGADSISSVDESNVRARAVRAAHERVRDVLLRRHPWNFAIKRDQLAASATEPAFGKDNAYPLPSDFLRLLPPDPELNSNSLDWQIESHDNGRAILTNDDAPLDVRYIWRVEDPNAMDPLFLELWSTEIALTICKKITGSNTLKESLRADVKTITAEAKKANAFENSSSEPPEDMFITVRG